jgi:hypothetical protein
LIEKPEVMAQELAENLDRWSDDYRDNEEQALGAVFFIRDKLRKQRAHINAWLDETSAAEINYNREPREVPPE